MIGSKSYKVFGGDHDEQYADPIEAMARATELFKLGINRVWVEETTVIYVITLD